MYFLLICGCGLGGAYNLIKVFWASLHIFLGLLCLVQVNWRECILALKRHKSRTHNNVNARLTRGKEAPLPFLSALSNTAR